MKTRLAPNPYLASLRRSGLAFALPALLPALALANPTGAEVVAGAVSISTPNALTTVVNQASHSAVVNWQQFNVGGTEVVQFIQPSASAAILNRVVGGSPSEILGNITANGRVFLINPQGILFGRTATVDVGGLWAGTMEVGNADFMAGNYLFTNATQGVGVANHGVIRAADGGFVVLAGESVQNTGLISTPRGTAALAAGSGVTLDLSGDGLVSVAVSGPALSAAAGVRNSGQVLAEGGKALLAARVSDLAATAVNNSGLVRAAGIIERNGQILLEGNGGSVVNSGTLDASNTSGRGGAVEVLSSHDITLANGSQLLARGLDGGYARVVAQRDLVMQAGSLLDGTALSAAGRGGFAEVSGHRGLTFGGTTRLGRGGMLLIDPSSISLTQTLDGNCSFGACFAAVDVVEQLDAGTDVGLIAGQSITVDLGGGSLTATGSGSLLLGIGAPSTPSDGLPGEYLGFVRSESTGSINFVNSNDTISVGGDLQVINASGGEGGAILANLQAGGNLTVLDGTDGSLTLAGTTYSAGGDLTISNEAGGFVSVASAGNVSIVSTGGSLSIGGGETSGLLLASSTPSLTLAASEAISLNGVDTITSQLVIQSANGAISTGNVFGNGNVSICSGFTSDCTKTAGVGGDVSTGRISAGSVLIAGNGDISVSDSLFAFSTDIIVRNFAALGLGSTTIAGSMESQGGIAVVSAGATTSLNQVTYNGSLSALPEGLAIAPAAAGQSVYVQSDAGATVTLNNDVAASGNTSFTGDLLFDVGALDGGSSNLGGNNITILSQGSVTSSSEVPFSIDADGAVSIQAGLSGSGGADVSVGSVFGSSLLVSSRSGSVNLLSDVSANGGISLCAGVGGDVACGAAPTSSGNESVTVSQFLQSSSINIAATGDIDTNGLFAYGGSVVINQYAVEGGGSLLPLLPQAAFTVTTGSVTSSNGGIFISTENANILSESLSSNGFVTVGDQLHGTYLLAQGDGANINVNQANATGSFFAQAQRNLTISNGLTVRGDFARTFAPAVAAQTPIEVAAPARLASATATLLAEEGDIVVGSGFSAFDIQSDLDAASLSVTAQQGNIFANGYTVVAGVLAGEVGQVVDGQHPLAADLLAFNPLASATFSAAPYNAGDGETPPRGGNVSLNGPVRIVTLNPVNFTTGGNVGSTSLFAGNALFSVEAGGDISIAAPVQVSGYGDVIARLNAGPQGSIDLNAGFGYGGFFDDFRQETPNSVEVTSFGAELNSTSNSGINLQRNFGTAQLEIGQDRRDTGLPSDTPASPGLQLLNYGGLRVAGPNASLGVSVGTAFFDQYVGEEIFGNTALDVRAYSLSNNEDVAFTAVSDFSSQSGVFVQQGGTATASISVSGAGDDPSSRGIPCDDCYDGYYDDDIETDRSLRISGNVLVQGPSASLFVAGRDNSLASSESPDQLMLNGNVEVRSNEQYFSQGDSRSPLLPRYSTQAGFTGGATPGERLVPNVTIGPGLEGGESFLISQAGEALFGVSALPIAEVEGRIVDGSGPVPVTGQLTINGSLTLNAPGFALAQVNANGFRVNGEVNLVSDPSNPGQLFGYLAEDEQIALSSYRCALADCSDFNTVVVQTGSALVGRFVHAIGSFAPATFGAAELRINGASGDPSSNVAIDGNVVVDGLTGLFAANTGDFFVNGSIDINPSRGGENQLNFQEDVTLTPVGFTTDEAGALPAGEVYGAPLNGSSFYNGGVNGLQVRADDITISGDASVFGVGLTSLQLIGSNSLEVDGNVSLTGVESQQIFAGQYYNSSDPTLGFPLFAGFGSVPVTGESGMVIGSRPLLAGYFTNGAGLTSQTVLSLSGDGRGEGGSSIDGNLTVNGEGLVSLAGVRTNVFGEVSINAAAGSASGNAGTIAEEFSPLALINLRGPQGDVFGDERESGLNYDFGDSPDSLINNAVSLGSNALSAFEDRFENGSGGNISITADAISYARGSSYTALNTLSVALSGVATTPGLLLETVSFTGNQVVLSNLNLSNSGVFTSTLNITGLSDSESGPAVSISNSRLEAGSIAVGSENGSIVLGNSNLLAHEDIGGGDGPALSVIANNGDVSVSGGSLVTTALTEATSLPRAVINGNSLSFANTVVAIAGALDAVADGDSDGISFSGGSVTAQSFNIVAEDSSITASGTPFTGMGLIQGNGLALNGSTLSLTGQVTLDSLGGPLLLQGGSATGAGQTLSLAGDSLSVLDYNSSLGSLVADIDGNSLFSTSDATGPFLIQADAFNLASGGSLTVERTALDGSGSFAGNGLSFTSSSLAARGASSFNSGSGALSIANASVSNGAPASALALLGASLSVNNSSLSLQNISSNIVGTSTINGNSTISATGLVLLSGGATTISSSTVNGGGSVTGNGVSFINSNVNMTGNLLVKSGLGALSLAATRVNGTGSALTLDGASLSLATGSNVTVSQLTATTPGNLALTGLSALSATSFNIVGGGAATVSNSTLIGAGSLLANGLSFSNALATLTGDTLLNAGTGALNSTSSTLNAAGRQLSLTGNGVLIDNSGVTAATLIVKSSAGFTARNSSGISTTAFDIGSTGVASLANVTLQGAGVVNANGVNIAGAVLNLNGATAINAGPGVLNIATSTTNATAQSLLLTGNSLLVSGSSLTAATLTSSISGTSGISSSTVNGNLRLVSGGEFTANASTFNGGGSVEGNGVSFLNSTVNNGSNLLVQAGAGTVVLSGSNFNGNTATVDVSGTGITIDNTDVITRALSIDSLAALTVRNTSALRAGSFDIVATGAFNSSSNSSLVGQGSVLANGITLQDTELSLFGNTSLDASSNALLIRNSSLSGFSFGNINLTGSSLELSGSNIGFFGASGTVLASSASTLLIDQSTVFAPYVLSSTGAATVNSSLIAGSGSLSGQGVTVSASEFFLDGFSQLNAGSGSLSVAESFFEGDPDFGDLQLLGNTIDFSASGASVARFLADAAGAVQILDGSSIGVQNTALIEGSSVLVRDSLITLGEAFVPDFNQETLREAGGGVVLAPGIILLADNGLTVNNSLISGYRRSLPNRQEDRLREAEQNPAPIPAETLSSVNVTLGAGSGVLVIDAASTINAPIIDATSLTGITVQNGSLLSTIAPVISTGDQVKIRSLVAGDEAINLTGGNILVANSRLQGGDVNLLANGPSAITLNGASIDGGDVTLAAAAITAAANSAVTAQQAINATGGNIMLADSSLQGGDVNLLADAASLTMSNASISGNAVKLTAATIASTAASTLAANSLLATAALQDYRLTTLTLGQGASGAAGDAALLDLIRAVRPDLLPASATPNASFNASTALTLGTVNGTAQYIEARTPNAQFTGPVRGATNLFFNLSPASNTQNFTVTNLDFARNNVGVFALGSGTYTGTIAVTDPNVAQPVNAGPRLSISDTPSTDFVFVFRQPDIIQPPPPPPPPPPEPEPEPEPIPFNAEVVVLSPEFEPDSTYEKKRKRSDVDERDGRPVTSPIEIIRIYDTQAEALCTLSGGAP